MKTVRKYYKWVGTLPVEATASDYDFYRDVKLALLPKGNTGTYKAVKGDTIQKYYHIEDYTKPWVQPVCTSNTSYGTFTGGGYFNEAKGNRTYYHVSDGVVSDTTIPSGGYDANSWGTTHSSSGWFNWALPEVIKITGITVRARNYAPWTDYAVTNGRFYTNSSGIVPIGNAFNFTSPGQTAVVSGIPASGILTNNIYFFKPGGGEYSGIMEMYITAYTLEEGKEDLYRDETYYLVVSE